MALTTKHNKQKRARLLHLLFSVAVLALLSGIITWTGEDKAPAANPGATGDAQVHHGSVSPLLFGTNLRLENGNDQFLLSSSTRQQLLDMRVRIIRMPVRPTLSNDTEIQAARAIKSIGAYALVVLRGAVDDAVLADDTRLINDVNSPLRLEAGGLFHLDSTATRHTFAGVPLWL